MFRFGSSFFFPQTKILNERRKDVQASIRPSLTLNEFEKELYIDMK